MKSKICVVADVPNWAFDYIARKVKKELDYKYDIRIEYFNRREEQDYLYEFIEKNDDCDLIHFLNRRILLLMDTDIFKQKVEASGRNYEQYIEEKRNKFSTGIYDHIDLDPEGIVNLAPIYNKYTKMYYTCSQKLFDIYNSIPEFKKPEMTVLDVVDKDIFYPTNTRYEDNELETRPLVIGWSGNSVHNDQGSVDLKGFHTIIKPVIDELLAEGYQLVEHYADRNIIWRDCYEMAIYYNEIDICLCASLCEGTPRPALESLYCGIPFITTDVGIVNEIFGEKQKRFILGDRDNGNNDAMIREKLKESLKELYYNRNLLRELSQENLAQARLIEKDIMKDFEIFFDKCLN